MPFMTGGKRDYKRELEWEHKKKPKRVKQRAARNTARKQAGLKVGDPRQADHIKELVRGGSNSPSNVRVVSARTNLHKEGLRKRAEANTPKKKQVASNKRRKPKG